MSTLQKLSELETRRSSISNGQDARVRIGKLLDENSFVEIGAFVLSRNTFYNVQTQTGPADGVVCGYGTVDGRLVYVYSQDTTVMGGAIGEMHAKKIIKLYQQAMKVGAPVVGFIDTAGLRLQEQLDGLQGFGRIFQIMAQASGIIPQIAVVCGDCGGGASFMAGLADFVFISNKKGQLFLNSPNTFQDQAASFDTVAKASVHLNESGVAQFGANEEEELISKVKTLLGFLPLNSEEDVPCYECTDDINRVEPSLNTFNFDHNTLTELIGAIVDQGEWFEINETYGENSFVGFARMNGSTIGIIGNKKNVLSYADVKKITKFVEQCNVFNIPLVTLTDIERFESTCETEKLGIIKEVSAMIKVFANASIPKINVILRQGYGSAYVAMNSQALGADYVYAWPTAKVATMNSQSAVRIIYREEIEKAEIAADIISEQMAVFEEEISSAFAVAERGYIDDIIEPAATRKRLIAALEVLFTKRA